MMWKVRGEVWSFLGKASHAVGANLVSLAVSVVTTLLVPRFLGVEEFGYFQLYLFYSSYVGLLHFGWNDGVLLRLGGSRYGELNRSHVYSQFLVLVAQQAVVALLIALVGILVLGDPQLRFVAIALAICLLLTGPQYMLLFVLQATLRIREYAQIVIAQRVFFAAWVVVALLAGRSSFEEIVVADLVSRLAATALAVYFCRAVVVRRLSSFVFVRTEVVETLAAGAPLMLASVAGSLVIGVVRFGISTQWSIAVFGQVSLALSLSNMALTAIVSIGSVAFPMLRRAPEAQFARIYASGRHILTAVAAMFLLLYYPTSHFLLAWLPAYAASVSYLALLFPLFIFQARSSLLVETFLKAQRRERAILFVNVAVLALSVVTTFLLTQVLVNLFAAVLSITVLSALRCIALELAVSRVVRPKLVWDLLLELSLVSAFLVSIAVLGALESFAVTLCAIVVWLYVTREKSIGAMRVLVRR